MKRILSFVLAVMAGTMWTVAAEKTVTCGESVTIRAVAKTHYHFVRWSDNNTQAQRTVTMDAAKTLKAYFEADATYSLTLGANDASLGVVTILSGGKAAYYPGDQVMVYASPSDNCRSFLYWDDDHSNTNPVRTITITAGTNNYTAVFELLEYNLIIQSDNETMGTVEFVED
jgi:hypothetical protein